MRIAVTGTPGTGKTTATERLGDRLDGTVEIVHLNDVIRAEGFSSETDETRDSLVADLDAVERWLDGRFEADRVIVESHLAHHLSADRVVVLRCAPEELGHRLDERGESNESIAENRESEALDIILAEAVETHGLETVYEIDATDRAPADVTAEIAAVAADEREPSAGTVSFVDSPHSP